MLIKEKLEILADAAKYDASCASSGSKRERMAGGIGNTEGMGICHSYTPDGRCVSLLKILMTNICLYDCSYCINRVSSPVRRAKFSVEEVVWLTMEFYKRNYIEGLFLSSGIISSPDQTMDDLIEIVRRLRVDEKFEGYIHLKAVAGCSSELMAKAGLYADRLSANIELPTQSDLNQLAPAKTHVEIRESMSHIADKILETKADTSKLRSKPIYAPGGQSTQMIVGATPSSDASILTTASDLYGSFGLKRVYYSAYSPIPHSNPALPALKPPLIREHRLYQADWLLRFYGFSVDELTTQEQPNLDLTQDPKLAWALRNRHVFPINVNTAPREMLLRIPGVGAKTVEKLLKARRYRSITLVDLSKLRVSLDKAKFFVVTSDHNPDAKLIDRQSVPLKPLRQKSLFDDDEILVNFSKKAAPPILAIPS